MVGADERSVVDDDHGRRLVLELLAEVLAHVPVERVPPLAQGFEAPTLLVGSRPCRRRRR